MKRKVLLGVLLAVGASWVVLPATGYPKPEFAKKEGNVPCTTCHIKPGKGDENLKDVGKCYREKKDLKACQAEGEKGKK